MNPYDEFIKVVIAIATPILTALVMALLAQLLRKFNIQLAAEQQARLEHIVRASILQTEEWAAQRARAALPLPKAADKLHRTIETVWEKVPDLTRAEVTAIVHAEL